MTTETIEYAYLDDLAERTAEWTGAREEAIAAAVQHLRAVRVECDSLRPYAYRAEETGSWWLVDEDDMAAAGAAILSGASDWYSLWCAGSAAEEVRASEHDVLDAICDAGGAAERDYACQCGEATGQSCDWSGQREDLVHLRYVPAALRGTAQAAGTGTRGPTAHHLYVSPTCAEMLAHTYDDEGEQTDELDEWVRIVGPAYT